jgi:histidyl-tRNA synthetase
LIPLKIEDEFMEAALKSISTRDSAHHTRMLDLLFSMPPDEHIDFTFDYLSVTSRGAATSSNAQMLREPSLHFLQLVQMKVFDTVSNIFRNHGAILFKTPIITPKSGIGSTKTNTAVYLDPQGTIIKLPYTLTTPFARYIAQQSAWTWSGAAMSSANAASLDGSMEDVSADRSADPDYHFDLRRYDISRVYRKNIIGGRPKELYECDFDIVWSSPISNQSAGAGGGLHASASSSSLSHMKDSRLAAREKLACLSAEVVKLTYEVLAEFVPAIGTSFLIKVNHSDLFEAILDVVLADATALSKVAAGSSMSSAAVRAQREDQALLRRDLCKLASSYTLFQGSWSKSPMRRQLMREKRLSTKKVDLLGALFQLKSEPGKPDTIFQKIRDTLFSIPEARLVLNEQAIIDQLEFIRNVFSYLKLFHHVDAHVVFDISVCGKHDSYSRGIVFQALVPNTNTDVGVERPTQNEDTGSSSSSAFGSSRSEPVTQNAFETIALGGQYDSLIASFMPPTASTPLSAVGVNFAIEKIVNAVAMFKMKPTVSVLRV